MSSRSVRSDCHFYDFGAVSAGGLAGRPYQDAENDWPRQLIILAYPGVRPAGAAIDANPDYIAMSMPRPALIALR